MNERGWGFAGLRGGWVKVLLQFDKGNGALENAKSNARLMHWLIC